MKPGIFLAAALAASMLIPAVQTANAQQSADGPVSTRAGDAEAGADLYGVECRGCHAVSIAPTLRGVIGRPAASVASFPGYSEPLKAKVGLVWSEGNIDAFLTAPQAFVPGSLMTKAIADAQQRADLIAYLKSLPPPRQ